MYSYEQVYDETLKYFNGNELATNVWISKYALKTPEGEYLELTPDDMHRRMAREFARIEQQYSNQDYDKTKLSEYGQKRLNRLTEDSIFELFKNFEKIIPQGSVMSVLGDKSIYASLSNCVVVPKPYDSFGGIMYTDQQLAQLFKRRMGVGVDISNLRPNGANVLNSARTTSGAVSFLERFSNTTLTTAQNSRRGALMATIDCRHPDIEEFIEIKKDLKKVTGANISIQWTDDFLQAVENNEDFVLRWPVESPVDKATYVKTVKAREIWDKMIQAAWQSAEPGVIFKDRMKNYTTDDKHDGFEYITTNPCLPDFAKVKTGQGVVNFGDIGVGSRIWSKEGWTTVIDKWETGIKPVYVYSFSPKEDISFVGTDNHRVVTKQGKLEIDYCYENKIAVDIFDDYYVPTNKTYIGDFPVYDITVDNESHTFWSNGVNVSNCSEIGMSNDSCRLIAVNMYHGVKNGFTENVYFDYNEWYQTIYEAQRLMDDLVDLELQSIERIIEKVESDPEPDHIKDTEIRTLRGLYDSGINGRRTGLGFTALGDTLAGLGLKYDSDEALKVIEKIMETKMLAEFDASIDLAIERGVFPAYKKENDVKNGFVQMLMNEYPDLYKRMNQYGRRNISISTTAPTGSLSMLAKIENEFGTSGGIEPVFSLWFTRRKKINPNDPNTRVDFVDDLGEKWQHFDVYHSGYKVWFENSNFNGDPKDFVKDSPYYGATANDIDWEQRVKIQSVAQKYITHSISSTVNLPEDVSIDEVNNIYLNAWKMGLKGITVYRDGSRSGVLVTKPDKQTGIVKNDAPKRPKGLPCKINNTVVKGEQWVVLVGFMNDDPYEVFAFRNGKMKHSDGVLIKHGRGKYDLICDEETIIEDVAGTHMTDEEQALTRVISLALRHGADLDFVYEQLEKSNGTIVSFSKAIMRSLKKFTKSLSTKEKCPECGEELTYQEGCQICLNPDCVGYSRC